MHLSVWSFVHAYLSSEEVRDKRVLEVGAFDVNGSVRPLVEALAPELYWGTDMRPGPGVDEVVDAASLVRQFGRKAFDVVISTEMLEHAQRWQDCLVNMLQVLKVGGVLLLTCRGPGFPQHDFPGDYWRFTPEQLQAALPSSWSSIVELDPQYPGVFLKAWCPSRWRFSQADILRMNKVTPLAS